jgi:membrane-bound serine protease (ClpP class)
MIWLQGFDSPARSSHGILISCRWKLVLAAILLGIPFGQPGAMGQEEKAAPGGRRAVIIPLNGTITPLLEHFIYRALDKAQQQEVDVIIIEIDSPGGFLDASLALSERFREIAWAETVAYIPREALSGAAIAALGCDKIFLHANARFGDAGPVFLGEDALFRHAPEKLRSDLAQQMREIARQGGRPPTLAEAMVDMDLLVFEVRNRETDEVAYLSELEIAALDAAEDWEKNGRLSSRVRGDFWKSWGLERLRWVSPTASSRTREVCSRNSS